MADLDPNPGDPPADNGAVITADPPAGDPPAGDPPAPDPADPPADDWRARLAGDDKKLLGYLARVPSEKDLVTRVKKHEDDIKAGKYLKPVGEDATDEEKAAWRTALGVPEKADGYLEKLPEGLVVGDDDKPYVDKFLEAMHAADAPPALANAALETYYGIVEEQAAAEADLARQTEAASVETLREEYGADYKRNLNVMEGFLNQQPQEVQAIFRHGKVPEFDADGEPTGRMIPVGFKADTVRWLLGLALAENPLATVVPGAGANQASAVADELAAIRERMRTDRTGYNKDEKMQARYRELLDAELKLKG